MDKDIKNIMVPTIIFFLASDGSPAHKEFLPGIKLGGSFPLKKIHEALQIAVSPEAGGDMKALRFRFSWYQTGNWESNLQKVIPRSAMKHLLIAVQEELCDKFDLQTAYKFAFLLIGSQEIRKGEPSNRVFIIHGRDENSKTRLAAFVEKQGFKPVILSRKPARGSKTIIEELESELTKADIIVALFTPDDEGRLRGTGEELKPRVRQNVLVEAGYALIQRRQDIIIVALGKTEIPSDLDGIRRIQADEWGFAIEQELVEALMD